MLVEKSCVELLRSCGINILIVVSDIPVFCWTTKYLPLKTFELATLSSMLLSLLLHCLVVDVAALQFVGPSMLVYSLTPNNFD